MLAPAWLSSLFLVLLAAPAFAQEAPGPAPVSCAVEWSHGKPAPEALCDAIGRALGRTVRRVDDARAIKSGDSVQVLDGDVFWTTVWLRGGQVKSFTRVSKTAAAGKEVAVLTRAIRALSRTRPPQKTCVRVEPNGGRKMRSTDLAYPWVELKKCRVQEAEVPDPWA